MNDDLLIEEFHEAGIWLPEEIEARERQLEILERQAKLWRGMLGQQVALAQSLQYQQVSALGRQQLGMLQGGIGSALGGLFGGLR